jgi:A/G-specific adenine glycosylase
MLQQTTVAAVVPYYRRWLERYPDIESLARAPLRSVLKSWQGLGYYSRARHLHRAARKIVKDLGGRLPGDYQALRRLPGFGPYTAAAVASLAFDEPRPVLEANVRRVLMRMFRLKDGSGPAVDRLLTARLQSLASRRHPGLFNQALMELGALVCRPGHPRCLACPVSGHCLAYRSGEQEIIPRPKTLDLRRVEAVVAVVERDGRYLIQQRPEKGLLAGLWEFPGGKVEPGESRVRALRRELGEELGAEVLELRPLITVKHAYTRFLVTLHAFECRLKPPLPRGPRLRWASLRGLRGYPFPSGSAKVVDFLGGKTRI